MLIHLEAPAYNPKGPDGQGWNRLSLCAHIGGSDNQCALLPRSYETLWEATHNRSRFGGYGTCRNSGNCDACPVFAAKPVTFGSFTDRVLVRILERVVNTGSLFPAVSRRAHLMNKPEDGWASRSYEVNWSWLVRLAGWKVGRRHADEHSEGFWLEKVNPDSHDGRPSPCDHGYLNPDFCTTCRINCNHGYSNPADCRTCN